MKKFVSLLLLVIGLAALWPLTQAYGWNGPCVSINNDCGNVGGGMGSCHAVAGDVPHCEGQCTSYCPSGEGDSYCAGESGDCTSHMSTCSIMLTYSCRLEITGCRCVETGVGPPCPHQSC